MIIKKLEIYFLTTCGAICMTLKQIFMKNLMMHVSVRIINSNICTKIFKKVNYSMICLNLKLFKRKKSNLYFISIITTHLQVQFFNLNKVKNHM